MASKLRVDHIEPVDGIPAGGGGGVIQIIHANTDVAVNESTIDTKYNTNLTATITPKFSTSKVLIIVSQSCMVRSTASGSYSMALHLLRGSTIIINGLGTGGSGSNISGRTEVNPSAYNVLQTMASLNYLDSPATTSATTYKTQAELVTSNCTMKLQEDNTQSFITLMEISG